MGGGDLAGNPTLYDAIQKAKKSSVPNDNIDRAVKRGSGRRSGRRGLQHDHVRGRTARRRRHADRVPHRQQEPRGTEVRIAMSRNGGSIADPGGVSYLFPARAS